MGVCLPLNCSQQCSFAWQQRYYISHLRPLSRKRGRLKFKVYFTLIDEWGTLALFTFKNLMSGQTWFIMEDWLLIHRWWLGGRSIKRSINWNLEQQIHHFLSIGFQLSHGRLNPSTHLLCDKSILEIILTDYIQIILTSISLRTQIQWLHWRKHNRHRKFY